MNDQTKIGRDNTVRFPGTLPPAVIQRIASEMVNRHSPHEIAEAITILIDLLDLLGGDPDAEDSEAHEAAGDEVDVAWVEWNTMRGSQKRGPNLIAGLEDDEEDDPAGQCDEDGINTEYRAAKQHSGAGCVISDPNFCSAGDDRGGTISFNLPGIYCQDAGPGDPDDAEHWQQTCNVPMPPVISADYNLFTDRRVDLGIANLQTSFRTNGNGVRSADSGNWLKPTSHYDRSPGSPV